MNEILFLAQIILLVSFSFGALKLGKTALTTWVSVQALIANLFVLKQVNLAGFHVTASDGFVIGSLLGLNFLQEYFGKEAARKATWICFFFMVFFALASIIHLLYEPSPYDVTQSAFLTILSPSPRLIAASMSVFFIVQQVDIRLFAFLKKSLPETSFALRSGISLTVSQFLDTFLFSFAGLYGLVVSMVDIILISFLIKLFVIFSFTAIMRVAKS